MRRVIVPLWVALAAAPVFAEDTAPSMEEMWRVVQEQRAEIERLRTRVDELEARRNPAGFPGSEPISMRPMENDAPAVPEPAREEKGGAVRFGYLAGAASGQFETDWGPYGAAFLDLTILERDPLLSQRLSGEILLAYHATQDEVVATSALLGMAETTTLESDTFTVFAGLKYTVEELGAFKPFLVLGPAYYVQGVKLRNGRVLGQVPPAPELEADEIPDAWWEPEAGFMIGGGFHVDVSSRIFLGFDGRYNFVGDKNNDFATISLDLGFRF